MYFLLYLNTCGSQMKEMALRESFGFHQIIDEVDEVACASAVRF